MSEKENQDAATPTLEEECEPIGEGVTPVTTEPTLESLNPVDTKPNVLDPVSMAEIPGGNVTWREQPFIKHQLENYPNLCERVGTNVEVLDLSKPELLKRYQDLLNQAQGENAKISIRTNYIKFSEKDGTFLVFIMYERFKFKGPMANY